MEVRKKTDILEAFRYGIDAVPEWFQDMLKMHNAYVLTKESAMVRTVINEEAYWAEIKLGYVVVKDVAGVVYPVEPAVFGMMFEIVRR